MDYILRKRKIFQIDYRNNIYTLILNQYEDGKIMDNFRPFELLDLIGKNVSMYENEFLQIWIRYIIGLSVCKEEHDLMERNIGALTFITMDYIDRHGDMDVATLFKFIDCFSQVLYSHGMVREDIKKTYSTVTKAIVDCFGDKIIDADLGVPFVGTDNYHHLLRHTP